MGFNIPMNITGALTGSGLMGQYLPTGSTSSALTTAVTLAALGGMASQSQSGFFGSAPQTGYNQQNYYAPPQNGYNQVPNNAYGQQQGGYTQIPNNAYGQSQGGYNQVPNNAYGQQQGYNQPPNNAYGQSQGGYNQVPNNAYGQQQGYNQPPNNAYGQQQGYSQPPNNAYAQPQGYNQVPNNAYAQPQGAFNSGQQQNVYSSPSRQQPPVMPAQPVQQAPFPAPVQQAAPIQQQAAPVRQQPAPVQQQAAPVRQPSAPRPVQRPVASPRVIPPRPAGSRPLRQGEKWTIANGEGKRPDSVTLLADWNVTDSRCDLDVCAFPLGENGKVPADEWFVFYGQTESPDKSVRYSNDAGARMSIDLSRADPKISRIAVAVTIYQALENGLHFGMVKDVCLRVEDASKNAEIARFDIQKPADGMTSLVLGELYRKNGEWKLNVMGAGVARDLAGFCSMYGVRLE